MDEKAKNFFAKKNIPFQDIIYFVRKNHKTELHLTNGNTIVTYLPIKVLLSVIPEGIFLSINKGVVVGKAHITHIVNNEYTMIDGVSFVGRVRTPGRHLLNKYELMSSPNSIKLPRHKGPTASIAEQFALLDELPMAFFVMEVVFEEKGVGVSYIFRYANKEMEKMYLLRQEQLVNHSFYEIFKNADRKWHLTFSEVAMNGVSRTTTTYSNYLDLQVKVYCYQPAPNFCACAIIKA